MDSKYKKMKQIVWKYLGEFADSATDKTLDINNPFVLSHIEDSVNKAIIEINNNGIDLYSGNKFVNKCKLSMVNGAVRIKLET